MDVASAGEVWLDGVNLSALDEDARARLRAEKVGFVFQNFQLPALTAKENVMLPLELAGIDQAAVLPSVFCRKSDCRTGWALSHHAVGGQQRVAIARALRESLLSCSPTNRPGTSIPAPASALSICCLSSMPVRVQHCACHPR